MDAAATDRSTLDEEQLDFELMKSDDDHAIISPINVGSAEIVYVSPASERPAIPPGYSTIFSAANIKQIIHPKHAWSWLASRATGRPSFTALADDTPSTQAGPSPPAFQPPPTRLGSTRSMPSQRVSSSISNDGLKPRPNQLVSNLSKASTFSRSTHGQWEKPRRKHHLSSSAAVADVRYDYTSRRNSKAPLDTLAGRSHLNSRGGAESSLLENAPRHMVDNRGDALKRPHHPGHDVSATDTAELKPATPTATTYGHHRHHHVGGESIDITIAASATALGREQLLDSTYSLPAELCEATGMRSFVEGEMASGTMSEASIEDEEVVVLTTVISGVGIWASRGMLAVAAMLCGSNFGCVKLLQETVPMSLAVALRFTVAVIPLLPFLIKINLGVFRAGVEIGILDALGFWAQAKSLRTTTASKSAFICSLAVIIIPLVDAVFGATNREGAKADKSTEAVGTRRQGMVFATLHGPWFPALLAVAGVACLELVGAESRPTRGDAWALVQPLCFGVCFWLTERSSRKYPEHTLSIVAAHLLTVAVLAIGWCIQAGQIPPSFRSLQETVLPSSGSLVVPLSLLWTGLVTTSLTVFLETLAMGKVSAAASTVIMSTEPIWATAFAAVLLGETLGWNTWMGAMLIVLACTWSSMGPAIESKLLVPIAAKGTAGTSPGGFIVNVDGVYEAVETESPQQARHGVDLL